MDLHYQREVTVGGLVLLAIVLFVGGTMWLRGRSFSSGHPIRIAFHDIGALKVASPVTVAGVQVGKVQGVNLVSPDSVLVAISLNPKIRPRSDANAEIVSLSLTGDVGIDLNPGTKGAVLPEGSIIPGIQQPGVMDQAAALSKRADTILTNVQTLTGPETVKQIQQSLASLNKLLNTMSSQLPPTTAQLNRTMATVQDLSARLDSTLANPALAHTLQRADTLTANLAQMTAQLTSTSAHLDSILAKVNSGQGTIGKLATDSALYHNLVRVTNSMDSLLIELKRNPGKIQVTAPIKVF